jgi:hypothetical protein
MVPSFLRSPPIMPLKNHMGSLIMLQRCIHRILRFCQDYWLQFAIDLLIGDN